MTNNEATSLIEPKVSSDSESLLEKDFAHNIYLMLSSEALASAKPPEDLSDAAENIFLTINENINKNGFDVGYIRQRLFNALFDDEIDVKNLTLLREYYTKPHVYIMEKILSEPLKKGKLVVAGNANPTDIGSDLDYSAKYDKKYDSYKIVQRELNRYGINFDVVDYKNNLQYLTVIPELTESKIEIKRYMESLFRLDGKLDMTIFPHTTLTVNGADILDLPVSDLRALALPNDPEITSLHIKNPLADFAGNSTKLILTALELKDQLEVVELYAYSDPDKEKQAIYAMNRKALTIAKSLKKMQQSLCNMDKSLEEELKDINHKSGCSVHSTVSQSVAYKNNISNGFEEVKIWHNGCSLQEFIEGDSEMIGIVDYLDRAIFAAMKMQETLVNYIAHRYDHDLPFEPDGQIENPYIVAGLQSPSRVVMAQSVKRLIDLNNIVRKELAEPISGIKFLDNFIVDIIDDNKLIYQPEFSANAEGLMDCLLFNFEKMNEGYYDYDDYGLEETPSNNIKDMDYQKKLVNGITARYK